MRLKSQSTEMTGGYPSYAAQQTYLNRPLASLVRHPPQMTLTRVADPQLSMRISRQPTRAKNGIAC